MLSWTPQAELERLKRQHAEREAQKQAERVAASAAASFSGRAAPASTPLPAQGPPQMTEELKRTLKVSRQNDPIDYHHSPIHPNSPSVIFYPTI